MMVICGSWVPCAAFIRPPAQPFASAHHNSCHGQTQARDASFKFNNVQQFSKLVFWV
uniref:Uncharacterized protein n=1 Tax=Antheraea pernyi nuclear polyhedrosis virus TaxID=161494 RepID=A0A1V1FNQ7_NPVAP|nr:hypothetical protein [Antheraea pernyi nucleopolyhedrovirus]